MCPEKGAESAGDVDTTDPGRLHIFPNWLEVTLTLVSLGEKDGIAAAAGQSTGGSGNKILSVGQKQK